MIRIRTFEGTIVDINEKEICAIEVRTGIFRIGLTSGHYYEVLPDQLKRITQKLKTKSIMAKQ